MPPVISVEHLSKAYRLGQIGTGRFRHAQPGAFTPFACTCGAGTGGPRARRGETANDLKLWWAKMRGT